MQWNDLTDLEQVNNISRESSEQKILIFKHSTSCSISRAVLDRLERSWSEDEMKSVKPYFLDLISYRQISNAIAEKFDIEHESPQVIIVEKDKPVYHQSHFGISYSELKNVAKTQTE
jgi:bacillithiol system protein YtxJ